MLLNIFIINLEFYILALNIKNDKHLFIYFNFFFYYKNKMLMINSIFFNLIIKKEKKSFKLNHQ